MITKEYIFAKYFGFRKNKKTTEKEEGTMKVTVRPMGGRAKTVEVAKNAKIKTILKEAGIDVSKSTTIIANGVFLKKNSTMGKHREILLIPKVEGGQ